MSITKHRILIAGWFSFNLPHNTAGDLLAKQSAITWATKAGFVCDIAVAQPSAPEEVETDTVSPNQYDSIVFVCGPLTESHILPFIKRFSGIRRIALNVSIVETSDLSKEFDVIIPRDSGAIIRPDISLATPSLAVPVIGLIYVGRQREYPTQQHDRVEQIVEEVVGKLGAATVRIDTKLPHNKYGLLSIAQVESVIRHMDITITTRLHGSILSLRNGTPPVVIDPVPEGAKVIRQMRALNWPLAYTIGELSSTQLETAIRRALEEKTRNLIPEIMNRATAELREIEATFIKALASRE